MKVLQLFNNWKWTGPAEYACNLAAALIEHGVETTLACGAPPQEAKDSFFTIARERGLRPCVDFALQKHFRLSDNLKDYRKLRTFIAGEQFSVIHTHLTNGHFLGATAARSASPSPVIIRTCYEYSGGGKRDRILYRYFTDGIVAVAQSTRSAIVDKQRIPPERVKYIPAAIDTGRFDPQKGIADNRSLWGIDRDTPVVGIVARVQKHRRFQIFLEGIAEALQEIPNLKVMVIGRGTHIKSLAMDPAKAMGMEKAFVFTGYRKADYVETLNCMDVKVFLVPGSDQSCRAVREAMALGKPVIVARRGMLSEMIDHGVNGLVIEDTPHDLAQAIITLAKDQELRQQFGTKAFEKAHTSYALREQVKSIIDFYEDCIQKKRGRL